MVALQPKKISRSHELSLGEACALLVATAIKSEEAGNYSLFTRAAQLWLHSIKKTQIIKNNASKLYLSWWSTKILLFLRLRSRPARSLLGQTDRTASTIKIQKHSLIEIVRQTIKMLMCSCHKLIIHTLLKIAQHDISKARDEARPSSPHCAPHFLSREIKSRAGCTDRHQQV